MKRLNRLILLGFLGLVGASAQPAQELVSTRISLTDPDAVFLVDGQSYRYTQNFVWPVGSSHVVQFPMSQLQADTEPFQYSPSGKARYSFSGWTWTATTVPPLNFTPPVISGATLLVVAQPALTEILGTVTKFFPIDFEFFDNGPETSCSPLIEIDGINRKGVLLFNNECLARNETRWVRPGVQTFIAYAYPGYYFQTFHMGNGPCPPTLCQVTTTAVGKDVAASAITLRIDSAVNIGVVFARAKRVRFATNPPGLQLLVDRAPITPLQQVFTDPLNVSDYCGNAHIPVKSPAGIWPKCSGDYDFIPGSAHQIAAEEIQTDPSGEFWVFQGFDNGMGQNSTYIAGTDVTRRDVIQANFIRGVRSQVHTNVPGLRIVIDGNDVPPSPRYGFIWAEGSTHQLRPPALQRDSSGRMWRFVRWSDDGPAERDVTVPPGADGFVVTAFFEVLGQIKLTSNVPGLHVTVDGADCQTPCILDKDPGQALAFAAPQNLAYGEASRYQFDAWAGLPAGLAQTATFNSEVQVFHARYHGAHRVLAQSDPDNAATFTFSPASPDGFYAEGSAVQITAKPASGFKFLRWEADLSGRDATATLPVLGPSSVLARMEKSNTPGSAVVHNAAGETPGGTVAPGSIIAIYGDSLANDLIVGPSNPLAQALGDTVVTVDDRLLPLIFVSPHQINAQLLSSLGEGEHTLRVRTTGKPDVTATFTVSRNAPGVFFNLTESGMPLVAALHEDGTPVTEESPARRGETITFFGTGLGLYDKPVFDGFLLPSTEVYNLLDPVKVVAGVPQNGAAGPNAAQIPSVRRDPAFAGGAAGMVGTNLIKVTLDSDLPPGNVLEISVAVNGAESNKVQLPVR